MEVAVNFNTDVGDAWEYADSPEYPEQMTWLLPTGMKSTT